MSDLLERIRSETWAKYARVEKQPPFMFSNGVVEDGLYFIKDSITILGTGETEERALADAWKGLQGQQYKLQNSKGASV